MFPFSTRQASILINAIFVLLSLGFTPSTARAATSLDFSVGAVESGLIPVVINMDNDLDVAWYEFHLHHTAGCLALN